VAVLILGVQSGLGSDMLRRIVWGIGWGSVILAAVVLRPDRPVAAVTGRTWIGQHVRRLGLPRWILLSSAGWVLFSIVGALVLLRPDIVLVGVMFGGLWLVLTSMLWLYQRGMQSAMQSFLEQQPGYREMLEQRQADRESLPYDPWLIEQVHERRRRERRERAHAEEE